MKKLVLGLFLIMIGFSFSAYADITIGRSKQYVSPLKASSLKSYNLLLTNQSRGYYEYAGMSGNLRVNLSSDDTEIGRLGFSFESSARKDVVSEIINITNELMPGRIKNLNEAQNKLINHLQQLESQNGERKLDVYNTNQLRFELEQNQDIIYLRITQ